MNVFVVILLIVLIIVVLFFWTTYNRLVVLRNNYEKAFAQIDVVLTRRHDLIPNIVAVAKKYMEHERETLEAVTAARNHANNSLNEAKGSLNNQDIMNLVSQAETTLGSTLGRLMAVVEDYPDLKADSQMIELSKELSSTENLIAAHRQTFNVDITDFNNALQVFPNNIVGGLFSFKEAALLPIEEGKREVPKVTF